MWGRLSLAAPEPDMVAVTDARGETDCTGVAERLCSFLVASGYEARALAADDDGVRRSRPEAAPDEGPGRPAGITILCAPGLLANPYSLGAVARSGAVVVLAKRGRTSRHDLERVRRELEAAGAKPAAAMMLR